MLLEPSFDHMVTLWDRNIFSVYSSIPYSMYTSQSPHSSIPAEIFTLQILD